MRLELIKLSASLNKAYRKTSLKRDQIELFKVNLKRLFDRVNEQESEEHLKNIVSDFLKDTWYKNLNEINTKRRADLVIHNGKSSSDTVGVIFEVKRPVNRSEMISEEKPNEKALHELLNYYLDERYINNNKEIKHLIVTNIHEWYIFDSADFERFFFENQKLIKQYKDWHDGLFGVKLNDWFYQEIAKPFIEKELPELRCTFFNLKSFETIIRKGDNLDDAKLIDLYKTLSPEHLLKKPFSNDSNTLNKEFYNELLHIIGLEETKEAGKKLIKRKRNETRNEGSLLENAINILKIRNKLSAIENPNQFGETEEDQLFSMGLELCLTWLNRILFLKLLEGQLVRYHRDNKEYSFLNYKMVRDFDELNELFFEVLAIPYGHRTKSVIDKFGHLPYLNSSLFEESELEQKTIVITELKGRLEIPTHSSTVLMDTGGKKISGKRNTLQYLFEFLGSFDFASDNTAEIQEQNKTLINASVLGLIFEKINGYKDGSFFTPGFITMYMCRETIRRVVVQKFNEKYNWECINVTDLYNKLEKVSLKEANDTINSLKICDPAVGSGHFLVSALNEIISIKNDLAILMDREGKRLKGYNVTIENDELILTNDDEIFSYNYEDKESQRIQETLFHEKQTIIENCLFGVDINPKSVMICRLRLWIELLKNAYYTSESKYRKLETLPNIDINIKAGNSLISRFPLKDLYKTNYLENKARDYRLFVDDYKNAKSSELKIGLRKLIAGFKEELKKQLPDQTTPLRKDLAKKTEAYALKFQSTNLFSQVMTDKEQKVKQKLEEEIKRLNEQITIIVNNPIYDNAFEWRFEYPEVLNDNGDFVGFDVVIGNPPYGVSIKGQYRITINNQFGKVPDFEVYFYFIGLGREILKKDSQLNLIIPNSILFNVFAKEFRISLLKNWELIEILDCSAFIIFEDATVRNVIIRFKNTENSFFIGYKNTLNAKTFSELSSRNLEIIQKTNLIDNNQNWGLVFRLSSNFITITNKIKKNQFLSEKFDVSQGYIPYRRSDLIRKFGKDKGGAIVDQRLWHSDTKINEEYKEELFGRNISKYAYSHSESYVWYGKHLACYVDLRFFTGKRLMVREITNPTIIACIIEEEFVNDPQLISIIPKSNNNLLSIEFLWGLLNSKLATFYHFNSSPKATKGAFPKILIEDLKHFPYPEIDSFNQPLVSMIESIVKKILTTKKSEPSPDTTSLEAEIDRMVYELYGLTEEEIRIVEGGS